MISVLELIRNEMEETLLKICDYHVHSEFSDDSQSSLDSIIQKAIALDISKICITDHLDIDFPVSEADGMSFQLDTPAYLSALKDIQEKYRDKIDIRLGVELGLMGHIADKIKKYTDTYPEYDFIIGSSHLVHGMDPYYPAYYEGKTETEAIREYFESILENVTLIDDYCVYGHLDYIVRYCPSGEKAFDFNQHKDLFEAIFKIIIEKGKGIEINTGSLYKNMSYAHPHMDILKLYKEMGGEIITVGSDAHKPEYLCYGFEDRARDMLQSLGYKYFCTYKDKKPEFNPL
jgi:histidinol-phosphatase (PHP family)